MALSISELATMTIESRTKKLADNVSENNALLAKLKMSKNIKPFTGGTSIYEELEYAENQTYKRYSGYDVLNISPSEHATSAQYNMKQIAIAVTMSGEEDLLNSGKEQEIELLASRIRNAEKTMSNNMSTDIYSDGTANGGKQIGGLQLLVADAGTGTVGGIDSSTYTWWQNAYYDFSDNGVTPGPATITQAMNTLWLSLVRGREHPQCIVADNTFFNYYWQSLQAIQRVMDVKKTTAGFSSLEYAGGQAEVLLDGGYNGSAPTSHMYFLNLEYLWMRPHSRRNMRALDPDRFSINQDAIVKLIGWAGNLTCSNRFMQGALVA